MSPAHNANNFLFLFYLEKKNLMKNDQKAKPKLPGALCYYVVVQSKRVALNFSLKWSHLK